MLTKLKLGANYPWAERNA